MATTFAPSTITALSPGHVRIDELESAYQRQAAARRQQRTAEIAQSLYPWPAAITRQEHVVLSRPLRIRTLIARIRLWFGAAAAPQSTCTRPRDGRGRFLSKAWQREAQSFTATDLAWFRSPITEVK
jgi:hypothetical protein